MEDYDSIEIAFVFEEESSADKFESLFELYIDNYRGQDTEVKPQFRFENSRHDVNASINLSEMAKKATISAKWSARIPMFDVSINNNVKISSKGQGNGLLSSSPFHLISFGCWIYPLQDASNGSIPQDIIHDRRNFVELLAKSANILRPTWGFGRRGGLAIGEDETIEDLAKRTRPPLYEYNIFRPETVDAIGLERLRSVPAWYVEELESGSVFLAVTEPPKQCGHEGQHCDEVAEELGLKLATPERYH